MPTATFFRLPEEKRERLIDACWDELTRVRFTDVSINRIIAAARIPRGSFYQYFNDKEDLIRYLLEDMRQYFIALLRNILEETGGDLFALPLAAYDRFISRQGHTDPMLALFIRLLVLNKGLDLQSFISPDRGFLIGEPRRFLPDPLWEAVDASKLRETKRWTRTGNRWLEQNLLYIPVRVAPDSLRQLSRQTTMVMELLKLNGTAPAPPRPSG